MHNAHNSHRVRTRIIRKIGVSVAAIAVAGLMAGGASPAAASSATFQIVYEANPSFCIEAQRAWIWTKETSWTAGDWSTAQLRLQRCDAIPSTPASTMDFMWTERNELVPEDLFASCPGGGPCAASHCIDGSNPRGRNYLYLRACNGQLRQKYQYTSAHQLHNSVDPPMCIAWDGNDPGVGDAVYTEPCLTANTKQRWTFAQTSIGTGPTSATGLR